MRFEKLSIFISFILIGLFLISCVSAIEDTNDDVCSQTDLYEDNDVLTIEDKDLLYKTEHDVLYKSDEKINSTVSATVNINENNVDISASIDENATGNISFLITGVENHTCNCSIVNGFANFKQNSLELGNYSLLIAYSGDSNYNSYLIPTNFTIVQKDPSFDLSVNITEDNVDILTTFDSDATGSVNFEITGVDEFSENITLSDGRALFSKNNLKVGCYNVIATYTGDDQFASRIGVGSFIISKRNSNFTVNVKLDYGSVNISSYLNEDATGNITVRFIGQQNTEITVSLNNGFADCAALLDEGNYQFIVTYSGDEKFNAKTLTGTFTMHKKTAEINATADLSNDNAKIIVNVDKAATGDINLILIGTDNITQTGKINNGKAVFNIKLSSGNYEVIITYSGDDKFNSNTFKSNLTVYEKVVLTKSDDVLNAYDEVEQNVSVIFENQTVDANTSSDVVNTEITQSTDSPSEVKITKLSSKIILSKKSFKVNVKSKKYSVILKDSKNNVIKNAKLTLKIKGKTYTATTNSKGKATFKITKLNKKGKFTASVKFSGNSNYKASKISVKITVK